MEGGNKRVSFDDDDDNVWKNKVKDEYSQYTKLVDGNDVMLPYYRDFIHEIFGRCPHINYWEKLFEYLESYGKHLKVKYKLIDYRNRDYSITWYSETDDYFANIFYGVYGDDDEYIIEIDVNVDIKTYIDAAEKHMQLNIGKHINELPVGLTEVEYEHCPEQNMFYGDDLYVDTPIASVKLPVYVEEYTTSYVEISIRDLLIDPNVCVYQHEEEQNVDGGYCENCVEVKYCSKKCQKKHWSTHKHDCNKCQKIK